jgi:hypothetical protein
MSSGPVAESQRFRVRKEPNGVAAKHSKRVIGSALTLPVRRVLTNAELEKLVDTNDQWIVTY